LNATDDPKTEPVWPGKRGIIAAGFLVWHKFYKYQFFWPVINFEKD
jgi:hypothetical protein